MKITELKRVSKSKIGKYHKNGIKSELHEDKTAELLCRYGFNVELVIPANTPKSNNPDFFMLGTIWETKAPHNFNKQTLKNRMKKAAKQAGRVIFDLRNLRKDYDETESFIVKLFIGNSKMRRMMIIKKSGEILDFIKQMCYNVGNGGDLVLN